MRHYITILLLLLISCSGGFAQSRPNTFDMVLDKKVREVRCVPCGEEGFCVVSEAQCRKYHRLTIVHVDTMMRTQWDTTLNIPQEWRLNQIFYEDGALVVFCRQHATKFYTSDWMTIFCYKTASRTLETREIADFLKLPPIVECHYYQGNYVFRTKKSNDDGVWFFPADAPSPFQFAFTQENHGQVLALDVDTAQGKTVICFNSGERTMYFETDFHGKSSFANIMDEAATGAQWLPVGKNHSVLMLYYQDDETFFMHPVNILNHRVTPSETVYCADIAAPNKLPSKATSKETIIVTPHNYVSFLPANTTCGNGRIACVTELYSSEYTNYFNGWYVEPRFNGYRYSRADVHFFDTNGVFLTNVTFPYDESASLHSSIYNVLNIRDLPNGDFLMYTLFGDELSTMLLDGNRSLKSPVNTSTIKFQRSVSGKRYKTVPAAVQPWFGNLFLLTAFRMNPGSQRKAGVFVTGMEYN